MTIRLDQDRSAPSPHGVARGWVVRGCAVAIGLAGAVGLQTRGLGGADTGLAVTAPQACVDASASAPNRRAAI